MKMKINIFWFRRDLRLDDNTALAHALNSDLPVLPVFILDRNIIDELNLDDPRISFIHQRLYLINSELEKSGSSLKIIKGDPLIVWKDLISSFDINNVFINKDYEPYAIERDLKIESLLKDHRIIFKKYKDQVIFEEGEILKPDNKPYTVFTPYKKRWMKRLYDNISVLDDKKVKDQKNFYQSFLPFPSLEEIGFHKGPIKVRPYGLSDADKPSYPEPMIDHVFARNRALMAYKG